MTWLTWIHWPAERRPNHDLHLTDGVSRVAQRAHPVVRRDIHPFALPAPRRTHDARMRPATALAHRRGGSCHRSARYAVPDRIGPAAAGAQLLTSPYGDGFAGASEIPSDFSLARIAPQLHTHHAGRGVARGKLPQRCHVLVGPVVAAVAARHRRPSRPPGLRWLPTARYPGMTSIRTKSPVSRTQFDDLP
jgi:hypothetical protein